MITEKQKEYNRTYYQKNKAKLIENSIKWEKENPEKYKKIKQKLYINNKEKFAERSKIYRTKNKEKIKDKYKLNKEEVSKNRREYYIKNRKDIIKKATIYKTNRRKTVLQERLKSTMRSRIAMALKNRSKKARKTRDLLGCSIEELKNYLESKFLPTMTWENYGRYWHIDHIIPCRVFNLVNEYEQKACFHYTNLRPLFAVTQIIDGIEYEGNLNKH
jgi:hypothetical protein